MICEINNMFRPLMDGYDEDAELICGVEQGEHALPGPKTYIVDRVPADEDDDAELDDIKKEELEAREAVQIIRENLGRKYSDPKSGETRKVDYRDIVILMRSFRRSAEGYRKVFREAGIPLYIDDKDGYFDTIEINVALALLSVIDNKRQDVPFISRLPDAASPADQRKGFPRSGSGRWPPGRSGPRGCRTAFCRTGPRRRARPA